MIDGKYCFLFHNMTPGGCLNTEIKIDTSPNLMWKQALGFNQSQFSGSWWSPCIYSHTHHAKDTFGSGRDTDGL